MSKNGLDFELTALEFLIRIFKDLGYEVVRARNQRTGTQDGYDNLIEVVTSKYKHQTIYAECKDYSTNLNYSESIVKIPHIISTHGKIDLLLFVSPHKDFNNPNEPSKLQPFYDIIGSQCPVSYLTPEYYIQEYFSIYPDLFKKIYKKDISELPGERKKELLDKFNKHIFSDKNLHKIVINEGDKPSYIGDIKVSEHHISRTFRTTHDKEPYIWDNPDQDNFLGKTIAESINGIVLLGNPGTGKTSELRHIALSMWSNREKDDVTPYYTSLKNFNSLSTIESILPENYRHLSYLVVILDGMDEVDKIANFRNKLEEFIDRRKPTEKNNALKFIISCRTSIYHKTAKDLNGFTLVYMNPIVESQAIRFLHNKFQMDFIGKQAGFDFWKYRDLIGNPFYLELIGEHYEQTGKIEISRSKLIKQYIANRLRDDENKKFLNDTYSQGKHLEQSKKLAFAMETMQLSAIDDLQATGIISDTSSLTKNPFIEQSVDKKWSFELKNIQEYFVAETLSKMGFEELIDLIRIDVRSNKVHPSWQNVLTHLLNMEFDQTDVYKKLVEWLVKNDIEIIFQADVELVGEDIRNTALQSYFQTHCIEKTLWIGNDGTLGKFADTAANIDYLFEKAMDKTINLRARLSAIVLLGDMSLSTEDNSKRVASLLLQSMDEFINNTTDLFQIMDRALSLIRKTIGKLRPKLIELAVGFATDYDHREFVHAVLPLVNAENFETHKNFVLQTFKKAIGETPWKHASKYGSIISTKEKIFDLFNEIKEPTILLDLFDFIGQRLTNHNVREKHIEKFIQHCSVALSSAKDSDKEGLIGIIIDVIITNKVYSMEEHLLASLAKECSIDEELFKKLLAVECDKNSNIYFLKLILKEDWYGHIVDYHNRKALTDNFLIRLRGRMQYDNLPSAVKFQEYVEHNSSFRFADRIEDSDALERLEYNRNSSQREFDVMFDPYKLKTQMENIFHHYGARELSYEDVDRFWDEYYKDFELQKNVSEYAKRFLWEILRKQPEKNKTIRIEHLGKVIAENELDRIEDIYHSFPKRSDSNIQISELQKGTLENWAYKSRRMVENYVVSPSRGNSSYESRTLTLFLNLLSYFKFSGFEESFLLDLINFVKYGHSNFKFIEDMVSSEKVAEKVLSTLEETDDPDARLPLLSYLKEKNVPFNLDQSGIKEEIIQCIKKSNYNYAKQLMELFFLEDSTFLKLTANLYLEKDEDRYLLQFILDNLAAHGEHAFIKEFLTNHYELLVGKNLLEEYQAIRYLVLTNGEVAFEKLRTIVVNTVSNAGDALHDLGYGSYSNPAAVDDLVAIARHCLSLPDYESIFNDWFKPLKMVTDALVSIGQNNELETCHTILEQIEAIAITHDVKENNKFHHENLMNSIRNVIYRLKSKPFALQKAINLNEKYKHLFYA